MTDLAPSTEEIRFAREGGVGIVTLSRPKALNALTLGMIRAMAPRLASWAEDPAVKAVVIEGEGDRAFCAGGDVRAVYDSVKTTPSDLNRTFFFEEYRLNRAIHRYPKPYIALIDGITMGGGLGLSRHGPFRVATERTMAAMPETGIGLFPDIGGTWFLNQCPGEQGMYLALTGARVKGADVLYAGFATHYVESRDLPALRQALIAADWSADAGAAAGATIARFAADPGPSSLAGMRSWIDRGFDGRSVEAIRERLAADGSEWAESTQATLAAKSPTSLKLTFQQLRRGRGMAIEEALVMEFRMVQRCMKGDDFFEGIRALLIDKDQKPAWQPARLDQVKEAEIERYFAPLDAGELTFD
jgi:enoyl-CoA hydratase